jgi:transcriptional regulator with XRE-family HTH domain
MNKISFNIRHLRELKKLSQEHLAEDLKITRARLGAYEEGRNEPPIEILIKLSEYFHVAIDALVKADLRKTDLQALITIGQNRLLFPVIIDKKNNDQVEVVTVKASAGYLNGYADPEYMEKLPVMKLPFSSPGKHRSFPVKGDSMPPLKTGDYVVGKFVESLGDVKTGKTYVLLTKEEGIVYKRIRMTNNENILELISDNVAYEPYNLNTSDILELWEFVCSLKISDSVEEEYDIGTVMKLLQTMKDDLKELNTRTGNSNLK